MASVYTVAQVTSYISHLFEEDFALKRISIQGEINKRKKHKMNTKCLERYIHYLLSVFSL